MKKCDNCGAPFDGGVCPYCGQAAEHTGASDPASFNTGFQQNTAPVYHTAQQPTAAPYSQPTPAASPKSKWTAFFLCLFLGYFGIHRFYIGKIGMGVLYLFTYGLFGIGWIVDLIMIATGKMQDSNGLYLEK